MRALCQETTRMYSRLDFHRHPQSLAKNQMFWIQNVHTSMSIWDVTDGKYNNLPSSELRS